MGFFTTKFEFMTTFWPLGGAKVWKSWIGFSSFWVQKILKFQFHMKWKVHSSFYRSFCIGVDPALVWFKKKRFSCISMHYINTAAKCLLLLPISFPNQTFCQKQKRKTCIENGLPLYLFSHYYFTTSSLVQFPILYCKIWKSRFSALKMATTRGNCTYIYLCVRKWQGKREDQMDF